MVLSTFQSIVRTMFLEQVLKHVKFYVAQEIAGLLMINLG